MDSLFGGSSSSGGGSRVFMQQAPYLAGLYNRAWQQSLGGGIPGFGQQLGAGMGGGMGMGMGMGMSGPTMQAGGSGGVPNASGIYGRNWEAAGGGRGALPPLPTGADPLGILGGQLLGSGVGMANQLGMLGQVGNPFAMGQIGQLGQGLGRLFSQQIAPTIGRQFAASGTYGGDRQALALGQAGEGIGQTFASGALDILGNSAGLALGANQAGLGSLGGLFGLGNAALFGSLPGLSSLIGGPAILGNASSSSSTGGIIPGMGQLAGGLGSMASGGLFG